MARDVFCAIILPFGGFNVEDRAPVVSSDSRNTDSQTTHTRKHEGRGAWVLTAYGISGLALFGILAYFFSDFLAH